MKSFLERGVSGEIGAFGQETQGRIKMRKELSQRVLKTKSADSVGYCPCSVIVVGFF